MLTTISQTAFSLLDTQILNLFTFMKVVRMLFITAVVSANVAMETFVYLSAFMTSYRCFQIMEARNGNFYFKDYAKIIGRKFIRLAAPYYLIWFLLWSLTPRVAEGALWYNTEKTYMTCQDDWLYTLLFIGNLVPAEMNIYQDCY